MFLRIDATKETPTTYGYLSIDWNEGVVATGENAPNDKPVIYSVDWSIFNKESN
jgi:hypothetical protein